MTRTLTLRRLAVAVAVLLPLAIAAASPLLAWRGPVYIAAGVAGVLALGALLVQPLLVAGDLTARPGAGRRPHRWLGAALVAAVAVHVGGLWLTSPPDVVDALLLRSPTPFSVWGVTAMWALLATATLALLRRPLRLSPRVWQLAHGALALVIVAGTIAHALLIEGTMGGWSKALLCLLVGLATLRALSRLPLRGRLRRRAG